MLTAKMLSEHYGQDTMVLAAAAEFASAVSFTPPTVSQAGREAPVLDKDACFLREVLAEIQTAWLPGHYKLPALDSEWQEDQLPAIRTHFFVRIHVFLPQP
jgi:hypothetical protein